MKRQKKNKWEKRVAINLAHYRLQGDVYALSAEIDENKPLENSVKEEGIFERFFGMLATGVRNEVRKNVTVGLKEELEKAKEELEEMKRKYLVMLAEYDNFRKRAQKEREGAYSDAYADAITALLPVFDNIERANTFTGTDGIAEGLNMIINQFKGSLAGLGIESFGEVGEDFDPNFHNAIMQTEDESLGENVIAEVFQKGYKRGDKIIRFAMVKVANCG